MAGYRKKYYDARHVCYAYMLGPERTEFRANDDGEPSSTAGKPILGQINSNELTDIQWTDRGLSRGSCRCHRPL